MIEILNTIFTGVAFLVVWFHTEALTEYAKLFGLSNLFKITEFENDCKNDFSLTYLSWLRTKHQNFFTKLITCPWCIGFWFLLTTSLFLSTLYIFPVIYVFTIVIYMFVEVKFFS